jgi:hypothetical protein
VQALRATEHGYAWVGIDSSSTPALETAEIWQASASCERPYFVRAVLQSKTKLKSYADLAPDEVRAWRNRSTRSESPSSAAEQRGVYRVASGSEQEGRRRNAEYDARLHAQHAEWYATVYKLEIQANQWEQRLNNISDQKVIISEATRRNFEANSASAAASASANGNFESQALFLLGLDGFPSDEEQAVEADCVQITPVKKVLQNANYLTEIWRWPVDYAAAFAIGLELMLIGLLLAPIVIWLVTGDPQAVKRYMRRSVKRFVTKVRTFHENKFVAGLLAVIQAFLVRVRAFLTTRLNYGAAELFPDSTFGPLY